ncbi:GAS2-like protein 2 [Thelohanellus kitauei]|uniref:GAS2-like protein 2 n=1 Tax=Thelohanellus kitauei TaxID=669202 RepID=A0A0C2MAH5_THEKT|nr:GAS2-like protein 2 [Thelohanellus kitauei]
MSKRQSVFPNLPTFADQDAKIRWLMEIELLIYMIHELSQWLNDLVSDEDIEFDAFFEKLRDGVVLCKLSMSLDGYNPNMTYLDYSNSKYKSHESCAKDKSGFQARSNIAIFLSWCRKNKIRETVMFETNDCFNSEFMGRRQVTICLWYVSLMFYRLGAPAPNLVKYQATTDSSSGSLLSLYFKYKSKHQISIDIYEKMKEQIPDADIDEYKHETALRYSDSPITDPAQCTDNVNSEISQESTQSHNLNTEKRETDDLSKFLQLDQLISGTQYSDKSRTVAKSISFDYREHINLLRSSDTNQILKGEKSIDGPDPISESYSSFQSTPATELISRNINIKIYEPSSSSESQVTMEPASPSKGINIHPLNQFLESQTGIESEIFKKENQVLDDRDSVNNETMVIKEVVSEEKLRTKNNDESDDTSKHIPKTPEEKPRKKGEQDPYERYSDMSKSKLDKISGEENDPLKTSAQSFLESLDKSAEERNQLIKTQGSSDDQSMMFTKIVDEETRRNNLFLIK